ncbi:hypothetical protein HAV15_007682 [Penicillium sp. str. |nr:hypothetical protein HAV15_007682 [Penicillium sp. str. \
MIIPTGNAEHQFLHTRGQFIANMQLEIDVLTSRQGVSPFRLALAVDNLSDLIDQLRDVGQTSAAMYREMPRCRTVRDRPSYYGHRDNLMCQYSNQHWITRQIEAVDRYLDL